jgi:hypothetical protein
VVIWYIFPFWHVLTKKILATLKLTREGFGNKKETKS